MAARLITVALVVFFTSTNSYAGDLFDLLKRMSEADQYQNYQGTFILRKADKLSTMRVAHGVNDEETWESLVSLDGERLKIVRRNNQVISVYPDREIVTIRHTSQSQSLHPKLPDNIDQLELFYSMRRLNDDRIANHHTLVVDLMPNDEYRYGYRYWVDKNTGMLLRCDLVAEDENNKKSVIEQMMFTSLDYLMASPESAFKLQMFEQYKQKVVDEPEVVLADSSTPQWVVKQLPKGFVLTQSIMRHSHLSADDGGHSSGARSPDLLHLVYSDGLASVSVFIEKNQGAKNHLQGLSSMGAVNAFGHAAEQHFITVVGEVPVKTVQTMAQSTVPSPVKPAVQSTLKSTMQLP